MNFKLIFSNPTFFAVFMLIIWDALKNYLKLHAAGTQLMFLVPVIAIALLDPRNRDIISDSLKKPLSIWFLWIIYSLFNTFVISDLSILGKSPLVLGSAIIISFLLVLFICSKYLDTARLTNLLIIAYFVRLLLSIVFDSGWFTGATSRFGEEFNANTIAIGALFIIVLIAIKKTQFSKNSTFDIILVVISVLTIIATGSRKNLLSLLILAITYLYVFRSRNLLKNVARYLFFTAIVGLVFMWILNNTFIGERTIGLYERTIYAREQNTPERMFDNRARYYVEGWALFKKHPINGVGLTNFQHYDSFSRSLHSEYMAQLTEGGVIGAFLFFLFYFTIIKKLLLITITA